MNEHVSSSHFSGKTVLEHLQEARNRGAIATKEVHGAEMSGFFSALAHSSKDTAAVFLVLFSLFKGLSIPINPIFFIGFTLGWVIWKTGRSALFGYARLERLHRLIEQERWEIEHHRDQEKQELIQIYQSKGFSGKLLDQVIETLMSDDNRLLQIMLEEELGLTLEAFEHPLKQAVGAFLGSLMSIPLIFCQIHYPSFGLPLLAFLIIILSSYAAAKLEKNNTMPFVIWNIALASFASLSLFFLVKILI